MEINTGEDMTTKISVVMPAYNAEHTIANAINSIINQTFQDWELIIINDGSTDNTRKEILKFPDERITYIGNPNNEGLVHVRNEGCTFARADIIATQDADDLSMPDRLEKCYQYLENKYCDFVYHGAYLNMWDTQFNCIGRKYIEAKPYIHSNPWKERLLKEQYIPGWPVFKKELWKKKPFRMETQYAYDWMMYLDWIYSDANSMHIDEGLYEYVRHENSASIRFEKEGLRQQSMEKIKEIMKNEYQVIMP